MVKRAWVVAADMGYGHQRAAYPLKDIANDRIINANSDKFISEDEKKIWRRYLGFYEWISKMDDFPLIGAFLFEIFNKLIDIAPYYPFMDLTKPNLATLYLNSKIKKGFGKSLISYVKEEEMPFITTFPVPAIVANYHKLKNIYCIITDTDLNRAWVPRNPSANTITYFSSCKHASHRLLAYGIKPKNIVMTGFPLPKENIGGKNSPITKKHLAKRLTNLDPEHVFLEHHKHTLKKVLRKDFDIKRKPDNLTLTYVIGGAGAQKKTAVEILNSLKNKLLLEKINLCIVVGTHVDLKQYYEDVITELGLKDKLEKNLSILWAMTKKDYFKAFNEQLNKTDLLWTKPSELSFYCALGIPIIITRPLGEQEVWNKRWLHEVGAGINQLEPKYVSEWLDEWLTDGRLARKAWNGFLYAPRMGTYKIEEILSKS